MIGDSMSTADRTIDSRLLECARKEFLTLGFEKASLRRICKDAEVTTGALYKRYGGKEDLFSALVDDTAQFLFSCMNYKYSLSKEPQSEAFLVKCWDMSEEVMSEWFNVLMARKEPFAMLLRCSSGTRYQDFEHEFAASMSRSNYLFYRQAYERGITKKIISEKDLHILDSAYWKAICEPFVHDYSRDEILSISEHICSFISYYDLLGIDKELISKYSNSDIEIIKFKRAEDDT